MKARKELPNVSEINIFNPQTMHTPVGYSHVAEVRRGKIVYIAGQVAMDRRGDLVGKDDVSAQTQQVFENLKSAVESVGGMMKDIVKLNYYLVDISHLPAVRAVRDTFINTENPPTSTAVQVSRLFRPEFLIEVDAVAAIGTS
jgi:2-iminobutanoate/2-iminopropanoate deaminase